MSPPTVSAEELAFYQNHVREVVREDGLVCLECGALHRRLGKHLALHGLKLAAYRAKWGYPRTARLAMPPRLEGAGSQLGVPAGTVEHYRTHIAESVQPDRVVCLECGGIYRMVGAHVRVHDLTVDQYREKWGYSANSSLVTAALHVRKRRIALGRNFGGMTPPGSWRKALRAARERPRTPARRETTLLMADLTRARLAAGWRPHEKRKVPDEILRALAGEGLHVREMAARVHRHPTHLARRLRALGLLVEGMPPPPLPVSAEELLARRGAGLTNKEIAERTGLTVPAVAGRLAKLRRQGVPLPHMHAGQVLAQRGLPDEQLIAFLQEGLGRAEIAVRVGLQKDTVGIRLRALRRKGRLPPDLGRPGRRPPRPTVSPEELAHLRAHFREALREDGVVCLECGARRQLLGPHLRAHDLTAAAYRAKWGYNRKTALIAGALHAQRGQRAIAQNLVARLPGRPPRAAPGPAAWGKAPLRPEARLNRREAMRARLASGWRPPKRPKRVADDALRSLAAEGLALKDIAARAGLAPGYARDRLRALGLRVPGMRPARPPFPSEETLARHRAGLWNGEIAARTGLTRQAVKSRVQWLRRKGGSVPAPAGPRPLVPRGVPDAAILALARKGLSPAEIAAQVGLSLRQIKKRLASLRRRGLVVAPPASLVPASLPPPDERLRALVAEGLTLRQIAARLGVSVKQVRARLRTLDLRTRRMAAPRLAAHDAEILALRRAGLWSGEIAARTGLPRWAVTRRLAELQAQGGEVARPRGARPDRRRRVDDEQVLALVREGLRPAAIAVRLGVEKGKVDDAIERLRRHGLVPPAGPRSQRVDDATLSALARAGLSAREIAARTGHHPVYVAKRLRRLPPLAVDPPRGGVIHVAHPFGPPGPVRLTLRGVSRAPRTAERR